MILAPSTGSLEGHIYPHHKEVHNLCMYASSVPTPLGSEILEVEWGEQSTVVGNGGNVEWGTWWG